MDDTLRAAIWDSLLQADQERRYWHRMACRYVTWDFRAKVFLAVVTSTTVAGWALWTDQPVVWKSLSGLASLLSIVLPIMALNDKVLSMTELHGKWLQLMHEYDALWRDQEFVDDSDVRSRLAAAKQVEGELSGKAINLPGQSRKLGFQTYREVLQERTK